MKAIAVIFCFVWLGVSAQPGIQWQKTFGGSVFDEAKSVLQTSDGGYIVTGITASGDGDIFGLRGGVDFWTIKLTENGAVQWKKILGGSGNDYAYSIDQTYDGGYVIAGYTESNNYDVSGNHGGDYDGWLVKLNAQGVLQWQKTYGGSEWDEFHSVKQTPDHGFILAGASASLDGDVTENKGLLDYWVVKLNENGNIQWQHTFGGSNEEQSYSVKLTSDGGYIVIGKTGSDDGDVVGNHGNSDYWVLKLSASGDLQWKQAYGGENADIGQDIIQTSDGGYILTGMTGSINSGDVMGNGDKGLLDFWTVKTDSIGNLQWQIPLGGSQPDRARKVVETIDGGYIVVGETESTDGEVSGGHGMAELWLVKLSATGELIWQKPYGGSKPDEGFAICNTNDGGFIMAGSTWSNDYDVAGSNYHGFDDFWIVKLSPESTPTHETQANKLDIFPNPATNSIYLQTPDNQPVETAHIVNLLGEELLHQTLSGKNEVDISSLPSGIYFVNAMTKDGLTFWGKVEKY